MVIEKVIDGVRFIRIEDVLRTERDINYTISLMASSLVICVFLYRKFYNYIDNSFKNQHILKTLSYMRKIPLILAILNIAWGICNLYV